MQNIFNAEDVNEIISRIEKLTSDSKPLWGTMSVAQMLAHCCVPYEITYENIHPKPGPFKKFILKTFIKSSVVGDKPYKRNSRTAPEFLIDDEKEFEKEKERLIAYLRKTLDLGPDHFNNRDYPNFGKLNTPEWNMLFYKHLNHHLEQFNV